MTIDKNKESKKIQMGLGCLRGAQDSLVTCCKADGATAEVEDKATSQKQGPQGHKK